jgi:predicted ribonuclease YlaK
MARQKANTQIQTDERPVLKAINNTLKIRIDDLKTFSPLTDNQKKFFDAYKIGDYFIALHGVAGTGKTFIALYKALEEVLDKGNPFNKIIIVRSAVPSREVGHLPGDLDEKTLIYKQPYQQICETLFGRKDAYQRLEEQHQIEFISTSFIRGQSFDDAIIIVDECQNMNWSEISTVMTRVGYRSKIIWCGDYRQTDLNKSRNDISGIKQFLAVAKNMEAFTHIEFTVDDIVRSSLVRDWIIACNDAGIDI